MAVMGYRTQDGLADYSFSIEFEQSGGFRVYIMFDPFRKGGDDIPDLPYQSFDSNGRRYVEWPARLETLGDARTVAELWAELVHRHHRAQLEYSELIQHYKRSKEQPGNSHKPPNRLDTLSQTTSDATSGPKGAPCDVQQKLTQGQAQCLPLPSFSLGTIGLR